MAENSREIILDTLLEMERSDVYDGRLIKAVLDKYAYLPSQDRAFIKRVTEGTLERKIELDYYLNHFSSVPVKKMKPLIRCLLRMSVYQLLYMEAVPDSAVCNEAVKLAQKRKFAGLKGFINGVLRTVAKEKAHMPLPDKTGDFESWLSVKYSMPRWIVERWIGIYGREVTEKLLQGLLQIHPVSLRFNTCISEEEREACIREMTDNGVILRQSTYLPYVYTARNTDDIRRLPGFAEGLFAVQDVSSALAVEAAGIGAEDFVMDICAAPGGKTVLASEKAARVLSRDVSEEKLAYICENLERMGRNNVETQVFDARVRDESRIEQADVVIMDVPCSGLGIMGKKRDIKYNVSPESMESLYELQKDILLNSWEYVKKGGTLLYSTCTINPAENREMVDWITENLPFEPVDIRDRMPGTLVEDYEKVRRQMPDSAHENDKCCMQLMPGYTEADGFFFAVLRRKE